MNGFYLSYPDTRSKLSLVDVVSPAIIEFLLEFVVEGILELLFGGL